MIIVCIEKIEKIIKITWVDDLIIATPDLENIKDIKSNLSQNFKKEL